MKKKGAVILTAVFSVLLAGCSWGRPDTSNVDLEPHIFTAEPTRKPAPEAEKKKEFRFGKTDNGTYRNDLMNLWFMFAEAGLKEDAESGGETYRGYTDGTAVYDEEAALRDMENGIAPTEFFAKEETEAGEKLYASVSVRVRADRTPAELLAEERLVSITENEEDRILYRDAEGKRISYTTGTTVLEGTQVIYEGEAGTDLNRVYYLNAGEYVYLIEIDIENGDTAEDLEQKADDIISRFVSM